ncbi:MAG: hypothetical protein HC869_15710 [Rhodospirillales bacterium]|nr:hypothetical protein [Rhodospirillales bacterium]
MVTGGMAIVDALVANGVDTVFGLPGAQLYPLFDALQQRSEIVTIFMNRATRVVVQIDWLIPALRGKHGTMVMALAQPLQIIHAQTMHKDEELAARCLRWLECLPLLA